MCVKEILIVEDESLVAESLKTILEDFGYKVPLYVSSGEDAIKKLEKIKPDLILMDIVLEGKLDGIETAKLITKEYDLPVIYLTAHSDEKTIKRAKITEPFGYITKPVDERQLSIAVEIVLYKHEMEKERKHLLKEIRTLQGIIPICAHCKNIRNDAGYWEKVEKYITEHTEARFSHGVCPDCYEKYYKEYENYDS